MNFFLWISTHSKVLVYLHSFEVEMMEQNLTKFHDGFSKLFGKLNSGWENTDITNILTKNL